MLREILSIALALTISVGSCGVGQLGGIVRERNEFAPLFVDNLHPANQAPVADPGGPYLGSEGDPVTFDGSASHDPDGDSLEYRWDFDNDGLWDTDWSLSSTVSHTWYDDYSGSIALEVRDGVSQVEEDVVVTGQFRYFGFVSAELAHAQSFVPTKSPLVKVIVDCSVNNPRVTPTDDLYLHVRESLNGSDLAVTSVSEKSLPRGPGGPEFWAEFDIPDIDVKVGEKYYIVFTSNTQPSPYEIHATSNLYQNGSLYSWSFAHGWQSLEEHYDLRFKTLTGREALTDIAYATVDVLNVPPAITSVSLPSGIEGTPITYSVSAIDPGMDSLSFDWDFGYGTSVQSFFPNNGSAPFTVSTNVTHTYGDNYNYLVAITVEDDDGGIVTYTASSDVTNVPPSVTVQLPSNVDEGEIVTFTATATDEGSDDLTLDWRFGDGRNTTTRFYNDGTGPDPYPSPEGPYPFTATDMIDHTYGDNGLYNVTLVVEDDDGGNATYTTTIMVHNVAPTIAPFGPFRIDEGLQITVATTAKDPGSDDLILTWGFEFGPTITSVYFNDGVGPDPYPSPWGTYPFSADDSPTHTYGDNYNYTVSLDVCDDDGDCTSHNTTVIVNNIAPTIRPFGPFTVDEGSPLDLTAVCTDQGSDDLSFTWEFELGPTIANTYYNDPIGPDPYPSPWGTYPFTVTNRVEHTYGDNGVFNVTLTVEDDDGGTATYTATITVNNVAPTVEVKAYILVNFTLRVAGEKWHNVEIYIYENGEEIGYAEVIRYPGNPDDQTATTGNVMCDVTETITAKVLYTPEDDPINGQMNGANPAWIILTFEDGSETELKHTFNVKHPETWEWEVVINPYTVGHEITFEATATDPGSDDLTFAWSWGDGAPDIIRTYYNDPSGLPDPSPSPWGTYPFHVTDWSKHTYSASGSYTVTVIVVDDDGGIGIATLLLYLR